MMRRIGLAAVAALSLAACRSEPKLNLDYEPAWRPTERQEPRLRVGEQYVCEKRINRLDCEPID